MIKKVLSVTLIIILLFSFAVLPAGAAKTDEAPSGAAVLPNSLFLQQSYSGMCTLSSMAMMLRARMYLSGNSSWNYITESTIRSDAWYEGIGLRYSFTYTQDSNTMTVSHSSVSGLSVSGLKSLLNSHPEGIVLLCNDVPHAVLVTDYQGDTFYCADPANTYSGVRRTLASSYTGERLGSQSAILSAADDYWYISSYSITGNINLGDDFYAMLSNTGNKKAVGIDSDRNVTVRDYQGYNDQIWHFIRQSDGGYRLIHVYTDIFLIGDNIASLEPQAGPHNKTWYIRKVGSGYGLAHYSSGVTKYLRPSSNSWTNGTILTLTTAESNININIISGSGNKPKEFRFLNEFSYTHHSLIELSWSKSKFANDYNVNVWKDNGELFLTENTRENGTFLFEPDTGYYGVYVKGQNSLGSTDRVITHFHVTKDIGDKDFCGLIVFDDCVAAYDAGAVILEHYSGYNNQAWNFLFQEDGSYLIQNMCSDTYLATSGETVYLTAEPKDNAKWYVGGYEEDDLTYLYNVSTGETLRLMPLDDKWEDGELLSVSAQSLDFYQISELNTGDATTILGDADADGVVTVMDATAIQKRLAGIPVSVGFCKEAADVSGDGLDIMDSSNIQKFISKRSVPYRIGQDQNSSTEPTEESIPSTVETAPPEDPTDTTIPLSETVLETAAPTETASPVETAAPTEK